jgi:anti-sigma B factor antagonist
MTFTDASSILCPGYVAVALHGELDVTDAPRVARALSAAAALGSQIIVDLAGLAFIDCGSLSALRGVRQQARQAGGDLVLAAPQQLVLRLLSLIDPAGSLLPVFASADEAANGIGRPAALACRPAEQAGGEVNPAGGAASPGGARYVAPVGMPGERRSP